MAVHLTGKTTQFETIVAVWSGFIIIFGYMSMFIKEKLYISEAFVALLVGIAFGPKSAGLIVPSEWGDVDTITHQLTRVTIAIQVMAVGVYLPYHYLKKEFLSMFMFVFPIMTVMWLVSGLFIFLIIPPLSFLESLVVAACIAPTDPILANSVVKGRFAEKHVPHHIQHILTAESGANDGMGFPFLFLAIYLLNSHSDTGAAVGKWFYLTWCYQLLLSIVIGVIVGWVARRLLYEAERRNFIERQSFLVFAIALALFLMSMVGIIGSDDLLASFAAGNSLSWDDWFRRETEESHLNDIIDLLLNLGVFVYIGAIMPWSSFSNDIVGLSFWRLVVLAILVLLFRRAPVCLLLKPLIPVLRTYREALFVGWFGPIGVGAVFFTVIAKENLKEYAAENPTTILLHSIDAIVLFIVLSSTLVHGTTIPILKLGTRIRSRTLSTSSTQNQVSMLPKLEFGQQINFRSQDDVATSATIDIPFSSEPNSGNRSLNPDENAKNEEVNRDSIVRFIEPINPRAIDPNENSARTLLDLFRGQTLTDESSRWTSASSRTEAALGENPEMVEEGDCTIAEDSREMAPYEQTTGNGVGRQPAAGEARRMMTLKGKTTKNV